ncbi:hypothetical protein [Salirhabdus sp. Marseille-P4669]|uniref:hypothetical protein n=1 Tax=Salirhabdus sp. Marseille-P4669 TaxID=2042310 RepID=UPI000C799D59|nr:hypothetical protein [Salirhabdus sp. Marseille-P4669]
MKEVTVTFIAQDDVKGGRYTIYKKAYQLNDEWIAYSSQNSIDLDWIKVCNEEGPVLDLVDKTFKTIAIDLQNVENINIKDEQVVTFLKCLVGKHAE